MRLESLAKYWFSERNFNCFAEFKIIQDYEKKKKKGYFRTGIHGDENAAGGSQFDNVALEHKPLRLLAQGLEDGQDLLGHHRQDLDVDTIELIETAPGPGLETDETVMKSNIFIAKHCWVSQCYTACPQTAQCTWRLHVLDKVQLLGSLLLSQ